MPVDLPSKGCNDQKNQSSLHENGEKWAAMNEVRKKDRAEVIDDLETSTKLDSIAVSRGRRGIPLGSHLPICLRALVPITAITSS